MIKMWHQFSRRSLNQVRLSSPGVIKSVEENFSNAELIFDIFHLTKPSKKQLTESTGKNRRERLTLEDALFCTVESIDIISYHVVWFDLL